MARLSRRIAALLIAAVGLMPATALARPSYVDLSANQTPLKKQGGRTTCIVFAAVAALEAAYNRAGFGQLDLSEEFLNHFGKMLWLHPKWSEVAAKGDDGAIFADCRQRYRRHRGRARERQGSRLGFSRGGQRARAHHLDAVQPRSAELPGRRARDAAHRL